LAQSRIVSDLQRLIGWKSQIFPTPLLFHALDWEWPRSNFWKLEFLR